MIGETWIGMRSDGMWRKQILLIILRCLKVGYLPGLTVEAPGGGGCHLFIIPRQPWVSAPVTKNAMSG